MMIGLFINTRQQTKHNKDTVNSIHGPEYHKLYIIHMQVTQVTRAYN